MDNNNNFSTPEAGASNQPVAPLTEQQPYSAQMGQQCASQPLPACPPQPLFPPQAINQQSYFYLPAPGNRVYVEHQHPIIKGIASSGYIIDEQGKKIIVDFIVQDNGTVMCAPKPVRAAKAPVPMVDAEGYEPKVFFRKCINSAGLALFADIALNLAVVLQCILALAVILVFTNVMGDWYIGSFFSDVMGSLDGSPGAGRYSELDIEFIVLVILGIASLVGHTLPYYLHSVRNRFAITPVLKKGAPIGSALPKAIVVAVGFTYSWVFIYMLLGGLLPDTFFGNSDFTLGTFNNSSPAAIIAYCVLSCVIAPLVEEFSFRGALLKSFSKYGTNFAIVFTALLFGLMHGNLLQAPFAFLTGLVLGYVAVRSGSIWRGVLIHFVVNAFSTAMELAAYFLPSGYTGWVQYAYYGIGAACVIGMIIILCMSAGKIKAVPVDPERCYVLRPEANTRVKHKFWRVALCGWMVAFIGYCVFSIVSYTGVLSFF